MFANQNNTQTALFAILALVVIWNIMKLMNSDIILVEAAAETEGFENTYLGSTENIPYSNFYERVERYNWAPPGFDNQCGCGQRLHSGGTQCCGVLAEPVVADSEPEVVEEFESTKPEHNCGIGCMRSRSPSQSPCNWYNAQNAGTPCSGDMSRWDVPHSPGANNTTGDCAWNYTSPRNILIDNSFQCPSPSYNAPVGLGGDYDGQLDGSLEQGWLGDNYSLTEQRQVPDMTNHVMSVPGAPLDNGIVPIPGSCALAMRAQRKCQQ